MSSMQTRCRFTLTLVLLAALAASCAAAGELRPITLAEALETALEHNTSHALFLWEQDLAQRRAALQKQPQIGAELHPAGLQNGTWQGPHGSLSLTMPLGSHLKLSGKVTVSLEDKELGIEPQGSLNLDYDFFALAQEAAPELTVEESRQRQVNSLVLQVFRLLVDLRKALDQRAYAQGVLEHLEAKLAAAQQVPNYDDLQLRRELRDQRASLAAAAERVNQLQLQLQNVLGSTEPIFYEPQLKVHSLDLEFSQEELEGEFLAASPELRRAEAELEQARAQLELERKSRGWQVKVSGGVQAGQDLNWSVGLTASKALYPRDVLVEELELAAAKAEHNLQGQENALLGELRSSLQALTSAQRQVGLLGELLAAAEEDLELRRRQQAAGLVTDLQVAEAALAAEKARFDYFHAQLDYALRAAELWQLCGRDLKDALFQVVN